MGTFLKILGLFSFIFLAMRTKSEQHNAKLFGIFCSRLHDLVSLCSLCNDLLLFLLVFVVIYCLFMPILKRN